MAGATPTLIPREQLFPLLLPKPPHPFPTPLQRRRVYGHLNAFRDLQREMDDLSDEDNDVEEAIQLVGKRGYTTYIPIGRSLTQHEERNDDDDSDADTSQQSGNEQQSPASEADAENESTQDLDASMDDLDDDGGGESDEEEDLDEMLEGNTEDYEDEPSDNV
ncbi:hypothetical protein CPB83DRAFT_856875 [Crepidotus variabilis]|uniref:Uncharacterized protein n=1 Tax=Crepidotus variabilis TaxID=179855 RepID=A0A9P6ED71_9AGAR|nr:hypothetical protein CPB83DRAFT_856875 [Crepidotus variabilis]